MLSVIRPSSSLCLQQSSSSTSSSSSSSSSSTYKEVVAHLTSKAPQPYGSIPRRKKTTRPRSSSTSSLSSPSSTSSTRTSLELLRTNTTSSTLRITTDTTSSPRSNGFWASLKAQYFPWSSAPTSPTTTGLLPLTPAATPLTAASLTDALLSSNHTSSSTSVYLHGGSSMATLASYPVSVAAMDKFKPLRTDTIPLKTFTYRETPVTEIKRPRALPTPSQKTPKVPSPTTSVSSEETLMEDVHPTDTVDLLDPLPRHLASRETRSNPDYLRMMASELQMIRARKLIAPLKPRGYLPRRRDAFRH
ncbi:hypothetical protein CPB97_004239, partial [Podila verticillata]